MSFNTEYELIRELVSFELTQLKNEMYKGFENFQILKKYISTPSKYIRSVLAFLFMKANGFEITEEQIRLQTIVELIHNASLIHDDVIDDSETRRGEKSFNKSEGNHIAVVTGDFILSVVLKKLVELNSIKLLDIFSETLNKMCTGEICQNSMKFKIPTMEQYIVKTYNKTGALFEASIESALILEKSGLITSFAKNFGIAFQLRDDILNITEKHLDSDIKNGIYTAPVIYSGNPQNPLAGIEKAKSLLNNYLSEAKNNLKILPENTYKNALIKLVELLNND